MHFSKILWNLAKSGEAFLYNMHKETLVIVPFGKYTGVWHYLKKSKTTTWQPYTLHHLAPKEVVDRKGKTIRFPLPNIVYALHGDGHPGKLHNQNRKALGYATLTWKKITSRKLGAIQDLIKQAAAKLGGDGRFEHGAALACGFAMPQFLRLVESDPDNARDRALQLYKYSSVLGAMRPAQRQRFVIRLLQNGIKPAMKRTFIGAKPEIINVICDTGIVPHLPGMIRSNWGTNNLNDFYRTMALANGFTWGRVKRINIEDWNQQ